MDLSNILKNGYILRNDNNYAFYKNNKIICSKSNIVFHNIIDWYHSNKIDKFNIYNIEYGTIDYPKMWFNLGFSIDNI